MGPDLQSVMVHRPTLGGLKNKLLVIRFKFMVWEFADLLEGSNSRRMKPTELRVPLQTVAI